MQDWCRVYSILIMVFLIDWTSLPKTFADSEFISENETLKRDMKIPIGYKGNKLHRITLTAGTQIQEIPEKISAARESLGLSTHIPLEQKSNFLYDFIWKTTNYGESKSPMLGRVVKLFVEAGKQVKPGDALYTIEAMKMEMIMRADVAGEVNKINATISDDVDLNHTIMTINPTEKTWSPIDQNAISGNNEKHAQFFPWEQNLPVNHEDELENHLSDNEQIAPAIDPKSETILPYDEQMFSEETSQKDIRKYTDNPPLIHSSKDYDASEQPTNADTLVFSPINPLVLNIFTYFDRILSGNKAQDLKFNLLNLLKFSPQSALKKHDKHIIDANSKVKTHTTDLELTKDAALKRVKIITSKFLIYLCKEQTYMIWLIVIFILSGFAAVIAVLVCLSRRGTFGQLNYDFKRLDPPVQTNLLRPRRGH